MPGAPEPDASCTCEEGLLPRREADKTNHHIQWLRTSGCVVFVAAAGLIVYYLLAGRFLLGQAPLTRLLLSQHDGIQGLGVSPRGDDRQYQHTVLPNGLQVVNVQDKRAVQTAFAMAVQAGSFDDPRSLPGLAHFCEHMLFLGTERYPEASGFDNFMSANGGFNNAYTADEVTVYFGELSKAAREEGLDRFADFFRAPLLDEKYVAKEVHAIDSEHAKNVQDPQRRIFEVAFSLANPESPLQQFHTGNVETLYNLPKKNGLDPVQSLKTYFDSYYCPEKMRLVTYGSEPLNVQLSEATKGFGTLNAKSDSCKSPRHSFSSPEPWGPKRMRRFVNVEGTLPHAELWLHFVLPDLTKEYQSQPLDYLQHMLGYGGTDSLARVLQDNLGLVSSLRPMFDANSAGTNLFLVMHLTNPGEKNVELILDVFYSYLSKLRKANVNMKLYDSLALINKLQWDWAEPASPSDTASTLAERMTRLPAEHLLSGDSLIAKPNSSLVSSLIAQLEPANMNVIFVGAASMDSSSLSQQTDIKTLPYYGVNYSVQMLSKAIPDASERWMSWLEGAVAPDLSSSLPTDLSISGTTDPVLPAAIDGVPNDIPLNNMHAVKTEAELDGTHPRDMDAELYGMRPHKINHPQELLQDALVSHGLLGKSAEVWYRTGWVTTSPKVQLQLTLRPVTKDTRPELPANEALRLSVFGDLLSEALVPKMVDLMATGVSYDISAGAGGLAFTFSGFMPLMPKLITKVLEEFNNFNGKASATQPARFNRITQEIRQGLDTYSDMPVTYAMRDRNMLLLRGAYSRAESLAALKEVTRESAATSVDDVLLSRPMQLTSLAMGNVAEKEANEVVFSFVNGLQMPKDVETDLTSKPERVTPVVRIVKPVEIRSMNPRPGDPNDAVVVSLIAGVSTVQSRVVVGLIGQILKAVAYNELRTARQLGYVVNAGASQVSNVQYVSCVVQGNALKADEVEGAIEHVLTHLLPERLKDLTEKEFNDYKDSFRQDLLQPPQTFQEEVSHFWGPITQGGQCFDVRRNMVTYLDSSLKSRDSLVNAWASLGNPTTGIRSKIAVKYFADSVPPRPTEDDAAATWAKQGVSGSALDLLRREHNQTIVFDHVDSKTRAELIKEGGHFPLDLNCDLESSASASPGPAPAPLFLSAASRHAF